MKIVYFSYLEDIHGISIGSVCKAKEFLNGLRQLGHEIHLFWRSHRPLRKGRESLERRINSPYRKMFRRYYHEPKLLLSNVKHLIEENQILKNIDPDVVITRLSLLRFSAVLLCQKMGIPFVVEIDNPPIHENHTYYGKDYLHLNCFAEYIEQKNLYYADAIFVLSNVLYDYFLQKGVPEDKMFFVPNGADPDTFFPAPKDVRLTKKWGIGDELIIGWIGSGWKWLNNMVEMVAQILSRYRNVKFLFVGGCPDKIRLQQLSRKLKCRDHVILKGYVPHRQIPRYLSVMDIVIAPYPEMSLWYPSPMKVFEYMASGKAVVASAVGQIEEIIQDGYNGYLFHSNDLDDLVHKVVNLIQSPDLLKKIGNNARKTILEKYTWKHHAQTIESILMDVLEKRN
ncbi:glycosyltransferase family 4 protein [bacterium]|nr:glycosyltransferase family 4 protein [bacterium]